MTENTLVILKPDAVQRALVGEIIARLERCGLKIIGMKMMTVDEATASAHYQADDNWLEDIGKKQRKSYARDGITLDDEDIVLGQHVRKGLIRFLQKSPVIAFVFSGNNAVKHVRKIVGETSPQESAPGTIRGDYSFDTYDLANKSNRPLHNLIHASSDVNEAKREIALWFTDSELHDWSRVDEAIIYDIYEK